MKKRSQLLRQIIMQNKCNKIAHSIEEFHKMGCMSVTLDVTALDEGEGILPGHYFYEELPIIVNAK